MRVCSPRARSMAAMRSSADGDSRPRVALCIVDAGEPLRGRQVGAVEAKRLAETGRSRTSRFPGRRSFGTSGENVSVSSEDFGERERSSSRISLPSALPADEGRGRPRFGGGRAFPYSLPIFSKLSVAAPGIITAAGSGCAMLEAT